MMVTALSIKLRFPEFEELDDSTVQFAVDEAARSVDDTWITADQAIAQSYLAAHYLATAQSGADTGGRLIISESIGQISTSYAASSPSQQSSSLRSTTYGDRFLQLLRLNHPPVVII